MNNDVPVLLDGGTRAMCYQVDGIAAIGQKASHGQVRAIHAARFNKIARY
jgi:hypothetical protein